MPNSLFDSERLVAAFTKIRDESGSDFIKELSELLISEHVFRDQIDKMMTKYNIDYDSDKEELLNLMLSYIQIVLEDDILTNEELFCLKQFKRTFKIKEGDFYNFCAERVSYIMIYQLYKIYVDKKVDQNEAMHKVALQEAFDLNYDQFLEFDINEAENALKKQADIIDLDTFIIDFYKRTRKGKSSYSRLISSDVMQEVYIRDQGKCQNCGVTKGLQFDHIIPFSKGGGNTTENIQLLCGHCNRKKSANFGVPNED